MQSQGKEILKELGSILFWVKITTHFNPECNTERGLYRTGNYIFQSLATFIRSIFVL